MQGGCYHPCAILLGHHCPPYSLQVARKRGGIIRAIYFYGKCSHREGVKKKNWKSGQADRLGWPPPLPWSGPVIVKNSRQVVIFKVILPLYIGKKWVKIFTNRSGQAGGRWPPRPPKAVRLTVFHSCFYAFPYPHCLFVGQSIVYFLKHPLRIF